MLKHEILIFYKLFNCIEKITIKEKKLESFKRKKKRK